MITDQCRISTAIPLQCHLGMITDQCRISTHRIINPWTLKLLHTWECQLW